MMAVFLPALILEVFSIYSIMKDFIYNLSLSFWIYFDFVTWNLFLVAPMIVVICIGATTIAKGKEFGNYIGKYSNFCVDDVAVHRVSSKIIVLFYQKLIPNISSGEFVVAQASHSANNLVVWIFQYWLASGSLYFRNRYDLYDHCGSVWKGWLISN